MTDDSAMAAEGASAGVAADLPPCSPAHFTALAAVRL